ncbi:MAG: UbiX family flavin prenyltransferase [Oscillospiraceae bacterium]
MKIILAVSGASGMMIARRTIEYLNQNDHQLFIVASDTAEEIFEYECGISLYDYLRNKKGIIRYKNKDLFSPIASGSNDAEAMIVLPCSCSLASRIATGCGNTLITRAAEVFIKERRKLAVCIRENPVSTITLKNLYELSLAGAYIFPLCPPYYNKFKTLDELYDALLGRILTSLNIPNDLCKVWGEINNEI